MSACHKHYLGTIWGGASGDIWRDPCPRRSPGKDLAPASSSLLTSREEPLLKGARPPIESGTVASRGRLISHHAQPMSLSTAASAMCWLPPVSSAVPPRPKLIPSTSCTCKDSCGRRAALITCRVCRELPVERSPSADLSRRCNPAILFDKHKLPTGGGGWSPPCLVQHELLGWAVIPGLHRGSSIV